LVEGVQEKKGHGELSLAPILLPYKTAWGGED
jgi:hypothetical protein